MIQFVLFNCFNYLQLTLASGFSVYKPSLDLELSLKVHCQKSTLYIYFYYDEDKFAYFRVKLSKKIAYSYLKVT